MPFLLNNCNDFGVQMYIYSIYCNNEYGFLPSYSVGNAGGGNRGYMMSTYELDNNDSNRDYNFAIGINNGSINGNKGLFSMEGITLNSSDMCSRLCYV